MIVAHSAACAAILSEDWNERWNGPDDGLIAAWQAGRDLAPQRPDLVARCLRDELPELPWKGHGRALKDLMPRYAPFFYLAMWQGLRGDDLHIDTATEVRLVCTATHQPVVYTARAAAWSPPDGIDENNFS